MKLFKKLLYKVERANLDIIWKRKHTAHPFFYTKFAQQFHRFNWYVYDVNFTIFGFLKGRHLVIQIEKSYRLAFRKTINSETLPYTNNISESYKIKGK